MINKILENFNLQGIKYFINLCTINQENNFMILPEEIRMKIWDLAHKQTFLKCYICKEIILYLKIDIRESLISENFIFKNGTCKCNECILKKLK